MSFELDRQAFEGLGRLCADAAQNCIISAPDPAGMERIEARFHGSAFDMHRHDTYAIGVTLHGVQTFRYRGATQHSLPGQIIVLHPDELHDGGAGTEDGLRYRMLYLEPSLMLDCLGGASLPFVRDGVVTDSAFCKTLLSALGPLERELDELFVDNFLTLLMQSLSRHAGQPSKPIGRTARRAATLTRDYLTENLHRPVRSEELEAVTGLDRYALSRHFRAAFSTSPHRFLLMRRLQRARRMIAAGEPLAQIAIEAGFSDQSHFNRQFKKALGMTPGRWSALVRGPAAAAAA
ncbi:AraC family transcriptional regulator [Mesorhizobium sp. M00.F.Ca.ET.186.01.1.1]|nr:AraC family transcriptional regulator [bacterium M00.F.Ca.ET.205.01.1.1]TGU49189.1 AraC family transcriptional regulator [bacterium M00.F.Ca.ET.152.01.1.1]TGV32930.1 AraC family transcriptional regulator [Mesorhizobium sp. M00.F.Ca.ET.186.01.1.1]TGZ40167.1 AraC family transcriptional regulator [bacterium M00.F.Ca.ET.162.01.1.1]